MPANERKAQLQPRQRQLLDAFIALGVGTPVTLNQLRKQMGLPLHAQQQLRRRISELAELGYEVGRVGQKGRQHLYALQHAEPVRPPKPRGSITQKVRAQVLNIAAGRCQMCGATVFDDKVNLVVDHKIPVDWGGGNDLANLWAICERCNSGKKHFFRSFDADLMRRCMSFPEEPKRIGELLKIFGETPPPRYLLAVVAGGAEWTKRLRQLRLLGWKIEKGWSREEGNWTYRLIQSRPWPENVWKAIKDAENRGK